MTLPLTGKKKGNHICKALDTGPGPQNVCNKLYARMFQIALLGKVRCPIRMWWLPQEAEVSLYKGSVAIVGIGFPSLGFPGLVLPPGVAWH